MPAAALLAAISLAQTLQSDCSFLDLATGRTATADSLQSTSNPAADAVDGSTSSRWSSGCCNSDGCNPVAVGSSNCDSAGSWLSVDLGSRVSICSVSILWEAAYATNYQIQCSDDDTSWTTLTSVTGNTLYSPTYAVSYLPTGTACRYVRVQMTLRGSVYGYSIHLLQVFGPAICEKSVDLAAGKTATSDSIQSDGLSATQAFDGDSATRWSSGCNTNCDSEPHWLAVDLASRLSVCGVSILWETARAANYQIQCSDDGTSWTSLTSVTGNQLSSPTAAVHYLPSGSACTQLRVYMTLRGTGYGYSAYTVQVWGPSESSASIYGDPHLQGAHRDRADFRGAHRGIYNLLSWSHVTPPLKVTGHPHVASHDIAQADPLPPFSLPSDALPPSPDCPHVLSPYRPRMLLAAGALQPAHCRRPGSKHLLQRAGSVMT